MSDALTQERRRLRTVRWLSNSEKGVQREPDTGKCPFPIRYFSGLRFTHRLGRLIYTHLEGQHMGISTGHDSSL